MSWAHGGYEAIRLIGSGGSGEVWSGRELATGDRVALKRLPLRSPDALVMARSEAGLLGTLTHPNLVSLHEVFAHEDAIVLVLDLAEGGSLADLLAQRGKLTPGEVVTVLTPIAAALSYAHNEAVLHCDVSPSNIVFDGQGKPMLADLGVARLFGAIDDVMSTPAYLDPVVAAGGPPGPAADVFAIAAVGYHCLSGHPVWRGQSVAEVMARAAEGDVPDLAALAPTAPPELVRVIMRGLGRQPHLRGTAAEFALDVRVATRAIPVELSAGRLVDEQTEPRSERGSEQTDGVAQLGRVDPIGVAGPRESDHRLVSVDRVDRLRPNRDDGGASPSRMRTNVVRRVKPEPVPPARRGRTRHLRRTQVRPRDLRKAAGKTESNSSRRVGGRWLLAAAAACLLAVAVFALDRGVSSSPKQSPVTQVAATSSAVPTVSSSGRPATTSTSTVVAEPDWSAVLAALDAAREQAYAKADPRLLERVYVPGPLLTQDVAQLNRQVPKACSLPGLRTTFGDVRIEQRTTSQTTLRVIASSGAAVLLCGGEPGASVPAIGPTSLRVTLAKSASGYLISGQRLAT